ncbi:MAG: hypothetical protein IPK82_28425 [Polyangiaceae bacterium]|nr:hypothetical protein [Polyangiaceae bacterium]
MTCRRALRIAAAVATLCCVHNGAASAQTPAASASSVAKSPAKPPDKRAAQKLLAQGNQLVGEGDYLGALEKFKAAYEKFASPKILLNVGTTLRQLGRNVEAADVYEAYLADPERDAAREKDVRRVLAEIDAVVGRLVVTVDDASAVLRLDGKQVDLFKPGESRRIEPGEHSIMAEKSGAPPAVQTVIVKARQEHLVQLRFAAPPPPPPPPPSNVQRTLGLALGGVGGATLIAGIVVGIVAVTQSDAAKSHCYKGGNACDRDGVDLDQSAKTSATISTVGFAVGAGVLAAGALLFVIAPSPTKSASPVTGFISVRPTSAGASLSVGGAF